MSRSAPAIPNPADELAEVRAEIARLRLREAGLRAAILRRRDEPVIGLLYRAEVEETILRVFDVDLLPEVIREDPLYWRLRVDEAVRCVPLRARHTVPRPGWPIERSPLH